MATIIYLTNVPSDASTGGQSYLTAGIGTRGSSASATSVSVAETTNPGSASTSSMTLLPSGTIAYWVTKPLSAAVTIAGTIGVNYWGAASGGTNCIDFQGFKFTGGAVSSVAVFTTSINVSQQTTTPTRQFSTIKPTSTAFSAGDRIAFLGNVNTSGATLSGVSTLGYNGNTENADGDTWFIFTEDITTTVAQGPAFVRGPGLQHLETLRYYTQVVSNYTGQMVSNDSKLEAVLNELAAQRDIQGA